MSLPHTDLSSLARSKLHLSTAARDTRSLHRWVLIKNSITTTTSPTLAASALNTSSSHHPQHHYNLSHVPQHPHQHQPLSSPSSSTDLDSADPEYDSDSFMFPDAGKLVHISAPLHSSAAEAQWLDTLLSQLRSDDDDEEEFGLDQPTVHVEDEEDSFLLSPLSSPLSSSDDLASPDPEAFFQTHHHHHYPVRPYPPYHAPSSSPVVYEDPLPYWHDGPKDEDEDTQVPDAIEDISDDESDTLQSPSLGRSNEAFLNFARLPGSSDSSSAPLPDAMVDPASIPLPDEERQARRYHDDDDGHHTPRRGLGRRPHVYVEPNDDVNFYPFDRDAPLLPFSNALHSYNYQEC